MALALVLNVAALNSVVSGGRVATFHHVAAPPLRTAPVRMFLKRRPPPEIMAIAQPDWRFKESSCTEAELVAIWNAFETVYGSREKALAASRKNQQARRRGVLRRASPR
jgi:hypothetical protein